MRHGVGVGVGVGWSCVLSKTTKNSKTTTSAKKYCSILKLEKQFGFTDTFKPKIRGPKNMLKMG